MLGNLFFNLATQCNPLHFDGVGGEADWYLPDKAWNDFVSNKTPD